MSTTVNSARLVRPEGDLEAEETNISRIAWTGGIAVTLVTTVVLGVAVATAGGGIWWHVALYCILAGVPFSYAIFSNVIMRRMETSVFARYRNQLLSQIEDLSEMVYRDELTGLYNRHHFNDVIKRELGAEYHTRFPSFEPDIVVTDVRMPPDHTDEGIRFAHELRDRFPDIGVLVLSQYDEPQHALRLFERGVAQRGYLLNGQLLRPARVVVKQYQ